MPVSGSTGRDASSRHVVGKTHAPHSHDSPDGDPQSLVASSNVAPHSSQSNRRHPCEMIRFGRKPEPRDAEDRSFVSFMFAASFVRGL
ncbi:hypothetical protein EBZ80_23325 [bacterium]|nr:hypothetical protein [bacterium]